MTTSSGIFGLPNNLSYATAKAAVVGLTRSLATAGGARHPGQPHRTRRRHADGRRVRARPPMTPEQVAPMAGFLAHESCPVTGEIYAAGAGRFARLFIAAVPGDDARGPVTYHRGRGRPLGCHQRREGYSVPDDLGGWSATFMGHLGPAAAERGPRPAASLLEQVGLLGDDLVVERLELPTSRRGGTRPARRSSWPRRAGWQIGEPAASASSWAWQVRSMVTNHHAASSTVRPTVSSPWFTRIAALWSPSAWAMRLPSSTSRTAPV